MRTAGDGGKGYEERTRGSCERPIGAASLREQSIQPPPPPPQSKIRGARSHTWARCMFSCLIPAGSPWQRVVSAVFDAFFWSGGSRMGLDRQLPIEPSVVGAAGWIKGSEGFPATHSEEPISGGARLLGVPPTARIKGVRVHCTA